MNTAPDTARETITLAGNWNFRLDPNGNGVAEKWYSQHFEDSLSVHHVFDINLVNKLLTKQIPS